MTKPTAAIGHMPFPGHRTLKQAQPDWFVQTMPTRCSTCGQDRAAPCYFSGCPKREAA